MMKVSFSSFLIVFSISLFHSTCLSQTSDTTKKWSVKFDGFVKTDFWYDSRQIVDSREGIVLLYPKNISPDKQGNDLNAIPSFNFSAMTSRLRAKTAGPEILGAKPTAVIEADFSGVSNADVNGFRLRHAIITLKWQKAELLMGNFWHPMFVTDVIPDVFSLNTGVPFQPFIRNPQITFTRTFGKFNIITSILSQRDYSSDGPDGRSYKYISNAGIPNTHLQLQFKSEKHTLGIAGDYKIIQPMTLSKQKVVNRNLLGSYAFMGYYKFSSPKFTAKMKTIVGQNMTEHLLLGGYAVKNEDAVTGIASYTPTNHIFSWVQFTYGKTIKPGVFMGYAKNLGTTEENAGIYFGTGNDIEYMYRISPNITYSTKHFWTSLEVEHTVAAFGKGKPDTKGRWKEYSEIANTRFLLVVMYFF